MPGSTFSSECVLQQGWSVIKLESLRMFFIFLKLSELNYCWGGKSNFLSTLPGSWLRPPMIKRLTEEKQI